MKIALIKGSPKPKHGASDFLLQRLRTLLDQEKEITITMHHFNKPTLNPDEMESLTESTIWVLAFPLYVDAIPSHLLSCLIQLEKFLVAYEEKKITVYALANCGFYEGRQNEVALEIIKNWCVKSGLTWGQGIGFGSGGMLLMLDRLFLNQVFYKDLRNALVELKSNLETCSLGQNIYLNTSIPRFAYKLGVHSSWRRSITANGLPRRSLSLKR